MNLNDARQLIEDNLDLIGTEHRDAIIDELIIIPTNRNHLAEIIRQVLLEEPYFQFFAGENDFIVLALLDFHDYPNSGILFYDDLLNILR